MNVARRTSPTPDKCTPTRCSHVAFTAANHCTATPQLHNLGARTVLWLSRRVIAPGTAAVVERLGVFKEVILPGTHYVWFGIERLRPIRFERSLLGDDGVVLRTDAYTTRRWDTRAQHLLLPPHTARSRDGARMSVAVLLRFRVSGASSVARFVYNTGDPVLTLKLSARQAVEESVPTATAAELVDMRSRDFAALHRALQDKCGETLGIEVEHCELRDVQTLDGGAGLPPGAAADVVGSGAVAVAVDGTGSGAYLEAPSAPPKGFTQPSELPPPG